jgi:hypothetical protein
MEGLKGELRRLGISGGQANRAMGMPEPKPDVVEGKERQEKLAMIAKAYNEGKITAYQATQLVARV